MVNGFVMGFDGFLVGFYGGFMGSNRILEDVPPGKRLQKTMERFTIDNAKTHELSTGPFSIANC